MGHILRITPRERHAAASVRILHLRSKSTAQLDSLLHKSFFPRRNILSHLVRQGCSDLFDRGCTPHPQPRRHGFSPYPAKLAQSPHHGVSQVSRLQGLAKLVLSPALTIPTLLPNPQQVNRCATVPTHPAPSVHRESRRRIHLSH